MRNAMIVAKKLGLTQKSRHRDRRPTLDELDKLMAHFLDRSIRRPSSVPMHRVIAFAIFSTRRQDEITRITWADLDKDGKRVLVRDMKNPGEKIGNDVWCDLPDPALAIIEAMPKHASPDLPLLHRCDQRGLHTGDAISGDRGSALPRPEARRRLAPIRDRLQRPTRGCCFRPPVMDVA